VKEKIMPIKNPINHSFFVLTNAKGLYLLEDSNGNRSWAAHRYNNVWDALQLTKEELVPMLADPSRYIEGAKKNDALIPMEVSAAYVVTPSEAIEDLEREEALKKLTDREVKLLGLTRDKE
jgi:hypothetical protein